MGRVAIVGGISVAVVAVAVFAFTRDKGPAYSDNITPETYSRIQERMTVDEVISIMGRQPDVDEDWIQRWYGSAAEINVRYTRVEDRRQVDAVLYLPKNYRR